MAGTNEIAELQKNAAVKIVFSTTEYKGGTYVDIREYVTSSSYTGFTKKGIRLPVNMLDELIEKLREVRSALPEGADGPPPPDGASEAAPGETAGC